MEKIGTAEYSIRRNVKDFSGKALWKFLCDFNRDAYRLGTYQEALDYIANLVDLHGYKKVELVARGW